MSRTLRVALTLLAAGMLFQITVGTEPKEPPYGQYFIRGRISRPGGLPVRNYVVKLVGNFYVPELREAAFFRRDTNIDRYPAVTDSLGEFYLIVATVPRADTVALEVSGVDRPTVRGSLLAVPAGGIEVTQTYNLDRPACSDCSSNPSTRTEIKGYQYHLPEQAIDLGS